MEAIERIEVVNAQERESGKKKAVANNPRAIFIEKRLRDLSAVERAPDELKQAVLAACAAS